MKTHFFSLVAAVALTACASTAQTPVLKIPPPSTTAETPPPPTHVDYVAITDKFLRDYNAQYVRLDPASSEAEWRSNTHIVPGDTTNAGATTRANQRVAAFPVSASNIQQLRDLLTHRDELDGLQTKQLETALYNAANNPQTVADMVKARIKAEAAQTEKLYGFDYKYTGKSLTNNDLDELLRKETSPAKRQQV